MAQVIESQLGVAVALSAVLSSSLTYYGAVLRFRNRINTHELAVDRRFDDVERKMSRINKRSAVSLRILVDIANKEGVLNRVTDQLGDLLLEDED